MAPQTFTVEVPMEYLISVMAEHMMLNKMLPPHQGGHIDVMFNQENDLVVFMFNWDDEADALGVPAYDAL